MLYEIVQFEAALEKTSVTDLMEMVWNIASYSVITLSFVSHLLCRKG